MSEWTAAETARHLIERRGIREARACAENMIADRDLVRGSDFWRDVLREIRAIVERGES